MKNLAKTTTRKSKRILWFTDTLDILNGMENSLRKLDRSTRQYNRELKVMTSLLPEEKTERTPPYVVELSHILTLPLPFFENQVLRIPSILSSLEEIHAYDPDIIYISTPGPIGLLGLLAARLLHIPVVGLYHADYPGLAEQNIKDISITTILKSYEKWFYGSMNTIYAFSKLQLDTLKGRGFKNNRLRLLPQDITSDTLVELLEEESKNAEKEKMEWAKSSSFDDLPVLV